MKKYFWSLLPTVAVIAYGPLALAAFSIEELHTATKTAVTEFTSDHSEHVEHFTGYKSWLSGEESKVKVYVTHDGMNMNFTYLCHKHDGSVECHAQ